MVKIKLKAQSSKLKVSFIILWVAIWLSPQIGFCDRIRLKGAADDFAGNEVKILEERDDAFVILIPKHEIELIKRERPTEIKLWHQKKILWEDTEDYITLYLPKERIVLPENYDAGVYDSAKALEEQLQETVAEQGRPQGMNFWQATGKIAGRVVKRGVPLADVRIKIVNVSQPGNALAQLFSPENAESKQVVLQTKSDQSGNYKFNSVPVGEYDIYWALPGAENWYRRLSEKPNIAVRVQQTTNYPDIELK